MSSETLLDVRSRHSALFYPQHWFNGHRFLRTLSNEGDLGPPRRVARAGRVAGDRARLPLAVDLALAYVRDPSHPVWRQYYFWCRDRDDLGQRIYVGDNGNGLEIHRHLHLTDRFGVPVWE